MKVDKNGEAEEFVVKVEVEKEGEVVVDEKEFMEVDIFEVVKKVEGEGIVEEFFKVEVFKDIEMKELVEVVVVEVNGEEKVVEEEIENKELIFGEFKFVVDVEVDKGNEIKEVEEKKEDGEFKFDVDVEVNKVNGIEEVEEKKIEVVVIIIEWIEGDEVGIRK